ncbi:MULTISPECIES: hypothetical protein [unclassified Candidatus Frackibacter]|nr:MULTISPECIES: hypothetical protein [unclassified Candidatus Frackibacter]
MSTDNNTKCTPLTTKKCPVKQDLCVEFDLVVTAKCDNIKIKCKPCDC